MTHGPQKFNYGLVAIGSVNAQILKPLVQVHSFFVHSFPQSYAMPVLKDSCHHLGMILLESIYQTPKPRMLNPYQTLEAIVP